MGVLITNYYLDAIHRISARELKRRKVGYARTVAGALALELAELDTIAALRQIRIWLGAMNTPFGSRDPLARMRAEVGASILHLSGDRSMAESPLNLAKDSKP